MKTLSALVALLPSSLGFAFPTPPARLIVNAAITLDLLHPESDGPLPPIASGSTVYWLTMSNSQQLDAVCQGEPPSGAASQAALLRLAVCPSLTSAPSPPASEVCVGTQLLLSDDMIQAWEFRLESGEACAYHIHTRPYIFINLAGSTTQAIGADGDDVGEPNLQQEGHCVFVPPNALGAHGVRNVGKESFLQFVIELKQCAGSGWAPPLSVQEAEERVTTLFRRLKAATAETAEADALVAELQAARDALAELQVDAQRRECERGIAAAAAGGGEAAAIALDALGASGIQPDQGCFNAALRACLLSEEPEQGEWALMLFEEAVNAGADGPSASMALAACVCAGGWLPAEQLLAAAIRLDCPPPQPALESLLRCCAAAEHGVVAAEAEAAARLSRQAARLLLSHGVSTTMTAKGWVITLPGVLSAAGAATLVDAALSRLLSMQLDAGPTRSVLNGDVRLALDEAATTSDAASEAAAAELDLQWTTAEMLSRLKTGEDGAARLASSLQPLLREQLGAAELIVGCSPSEEPPASFVLTLARADVEEWLRERCVEAWSTEGTQLRADRIAAEERAAAEEAAREAEEAAREAARAASQAATDTLRAKRTSKWERANQRVVKLAERERLSKRSVFEVAIDDMVVKAVADSEQAEASPPDSVVDAPAEEAAREAAGVVASAADDEVSTLSGVGPTRAAKLRAAGIATIGDLAPMEDEAMESAAKSHGLPKTSMARWRAEARERCGLPDL